MSDIPPLLFVDDEPGILAALRRVLRPYGYLLLAHGSRLSAEIIAQLRRIDSQIPFPLTPHLHQEAP